MNSLKCNPMTKLTLYSTLEYITSKTVGRNRPLQLNVTDCVQQSATQGSNISSKE